MCLLQYEKASGGDSMNWRDLSVSACGTYHECDGQPAYSGRFDEVLKFHAPGLAPVKCGDEAWHVGPDGNAAYSRRFIRTFGFYEGFAAVQAQDAWHHVRPDGSDAYPERYDWCGNFQGERCTVRLRDGRYRHVRSDGSFAYPETWRYAGDYKDGFCVIQSDAGLCTHLDLNGKPLHDKWFADLGVFHKGFARARDGDGWMHVDLCGGPAYARRLAAVEPFYNGQARVERFDGGLEVINEQGQRLVELRPARQSKFGALSGDMVGDWRTKAISDASNVRPLLVLIGSIGAGKTTLAKALHACTGMRFASIDGERTVYGDGSTSGEMRAWAALLGKIEQGTCDAVEFSGSGPLVWHVQQAIRNAGRSYRVVWVRSPLEICLDRVQARKTAVPYPFSAEALEKTTRELHARLEREMADETYWKFHYVTHIDGRQPVEDQIADVTFLISRLKPDEY